MTNPETSLAPIIQALHKAKSEWLDAQMKRIMPPELYDLKQSEKGSDRMRLAKWMSANKVSLKERLPENESKMPDGSIQIGGNSDPAKSEVWMCDNLISKFSVRFKDGKCETWAKDYPLPQQ